VVSGSAVDAVGGADVAGVSLVDELGVDEDSGAGGLGTDVNPGGALTPGGSARGAPR